MSAHNFNIAANFACGQSFCGNNFNIINELDRAW
jgi:hypothetical protein